MAASEQTKLKPRRLWNWRSLLFELLIVFIGVYLAFFLSSLQEANKREAEQLKVLSSLKLEMERFRIQFPEFAHHQEAKIKEWKADYQKGKVSSFYTYRFIQPQYEYEVLEYAIDEQESQIIDFDLFNALRSCLAEIRRLEDAENRMTELALQYQPVPDGLRRSEAGQIHMNRNFFLFERFILFSTGRAGILRDLAKVAASTVELINTRLPAKRKKEVEIQLVKTYVEKMEIGKNDLHQLLDMSNAYFPDLSQEEIEELLSEVKE